MFIPEEILSKYESKRILYKEDFELYTDLLNKYENLQENDYTNAFIIQKKAVALYDRFSEISYQIRTFEKKKIIGRDAALKDRIKDILSNLKDIHVDSRMIWGKAKDDLKSLNYSII